MRLRQQTTNGANVLRSISELRPEMAIVRHTGQSRAGTLSTLDGRNRWKKIGVAAAIGIAFGIAASVLSPSARSPVQNASQLVVTRSSYIIPSETSNRVALAQSSATVVGNGSGASAVTDPEEMERLKIRNRRLEALISVLRDRKQHQAN